MNNLNNIQQNALGAFEGNPRKLASWIELMKIRSLQGPNKENAAQKIQDVSEIFTWDESFSVEVEFVRKQWFSVTEPCDSESEAVEFLAEGEVDDDQLNIDSASFEGDVFADGDGPEEMRRQIVVTVKNLFPKDSLSLFEDVPSWEDVVGHQ